MSVEQQTDKHVRNTFLALLFAVVIFILIFVLEISASLKNLNVLLSTNKALALSAFLLIGIFIFIETFSKYYLKIIKIRSIARIMGATGFVFALIHAISVMFLLTGFFSKDWLDEQSLSINFARASLIGLVALFAGFIKTIAEKLGEKRWLYFQIFGYLSFLFILLHTMFLVKPSYYQLGKDLLSTVRQLELIFIFIFIITLIILRIILYFLNKKFSLQFKIIVHTLLYFTVSAIIIVAYFAIADTQRHYEETFHQNRHMLDYLKDLAADSSRQHVYDMADSLTESSQRELTVFFLDSDRRILHHPEKGKEDTPYFIFGNKPSEASAIGDEWNIKYNMGGNTYLDTISKLDSETYVVVSTNYTIESQGFTRQVVYSSFLVVLVTFVTAIVTLLFGKKNIIEPIRKITEGSEKISEGNFDSVINIKSNDEFQTLATVLNEMSEKMKKQINDLMKLDRLKNEFIAIASHNLRTPLTTLRGYLDTLDSGQLGKLSVKQKEALKKAQQSETQLVSLTEGLINITSLEREGVKIEKNSLDLKTLIEEILKQVETQAKVKNVKIINNIGKESINTIGDEAKLKQAFLAVLENSIKFNSKGGTVTLEKIIDDTKEPVIGRKEVIITIKDTGIGISKEEKENVFQKFNRGTSTYTYEYEGVGLGLYLSRLIIQAHHGRIWFESDEGKGTTFYISLSSTDT